MMSRGSRALRQVGASALGVRELFGILKEVSFDHLRDEARLPPRLLLLAANHADVVSLRDELGGDGSAGTIDIASFNDIPAHLEQYDAVVCFNASPRERAQTGLKRLLTDAELSARVLTVQFPPALARGVDPLTAPSTEALSDLKRRILTRLPHRQLALGRWLPGFRREAATATINATARANAEFAFLSNLPAMIPLVGGLIAAGADTLVLTKNQLMMIYKLAAIHDRDLAQPWRLYTEMAPVVGAGLFWRTVAREFTSFIPLAGGTIPKTIVAYAGTAVAGQAANYYYEFGRKPTAAHMKRFSRRAYEIARNLRLPAREGPHGAIDATFKERATPAIAALPTSEEGAPDLARTAVPGATTRQAGTNRVDGAGTAHGMGTAP